MKAFFLFASCILLVIPNLVCSASKKNVLKKGDAAPTFTTQDETGKCITFPKDYPGRKALVFYPRASTPGCTKEMCGLNDNFNNLKAKKISIIGISTSKPKDQTAFKKKHNFSFPLLTATDEICKAYNVHGTFFIDRKTFLIDEHNNIVKIIEKVDTKNPSEQIIKAFN